MQPSQTQTTDQAQTSESTASSGAASSRDSGKVQLKASLRGMPYDEQVAALRPTQAKGKAQGDVHAHAAKGTEGSGGALPHLEAIQKSFGSHDVSGVSAHVGGKAASATQAMGATAYASGNNVAFGQSPDLHTAAHEAAHVVQQRGGVSLKGGVGQRGDTYENHADSVADAVVAGKSSQGLLDTMAAGGGAAGGGAAGGGVQKQAVQMDALSSGTTSSSQQDATRSTAIDRGAQLGSGEMVVRGASQGVAMTATGTSMAANPDFEKDAIAFEVKLGRSAYGRGNGPAGAMAAKAKAYLIQKTGATAWKASEVKLKETLEKLGSDSPAWSGTVGKQIDDLLAVFDTGNVATRMCHLEGVWGLLSQDIKADDSAMNAKLARAGILLEDLQEFREEKANNPYYIPENSEVAGQGATRLKNPNAGQHRSVRTVGQVGVPLSGAEAEVQIPGHNRNDPTPQDAILKWEEGERIWMMNEKNRWVHLMRQVSMPVAAGPSGTTNKLMNLGAVLGMSPYDTRLACIGYLLPANHHSLAEIMEGAAPHGAADFKRGREMYTSIQPWSTAELRVFGGGKFPHETHGADPVAVPQLA